MEQTVNITETSRVLVIGLARSGFAAAKLLLEKGFDVNVSEMRDEEDIAGRRQVLESLGARVETGTHSQESLNGVDLVVASPGVPDENPLIEEALSRDIPIIGELELASRYADVPIIAVTGTNGKTTTASLIAHVLKSSGRQTVLAGNVGIPLSSVLDEAENSDWLVLEVSSYQLARTVTFHPRISILLNISSDHLDRYRSFEEYVSHKKRLFMNQTVKDTAVLNGEEETIRSIADTLDAKVLTFSRLGEVREGAYPDGETIRLRTRDALVSICNISSIPLPGRHNLQNVLAAVCALTAAGCEPDELQRGIQNFVGLPHRLEELGTFRGIRFVNDSKATNVSSTSHAVDSFREPVILIMGGRHKGEPYTGLIPIMQNKVKHLVVIGEAAPLIERDLSEAVETSRATDLESAFHTALKHASSGDVVLLSPGCSSFDMFENYEERGETFRGFVYGLRE